MLTQPMTNSNGIKIWFEIEPRCNLDCKFCYDHVEDVASLKHTIDDTNQLLEILDKLFSSITVESIALSGGEPLLRHDLEEIIKHIQQHHVPIILTTNGILLTEQRIIRYIKLGVSTFQISLHSADREIHNYITSRSSWDDTIASIVRTTQNGGCVVLVFVATQVNATHFRDVLEIAVLCGISKVVFNRFLPGKQGAHKNDEQPLRLSIANEMDIKQVLYESNSFARSHNLKISLGTPIMLTDKEQKELDCVEPTSCPVDANQKRFILNAKGDIRRCIQSRVIIGNILKDDVNTIFQRNCGLITFSKEVAGIKDCMMIAMG